MKERPILFSAPMVRALLAGTKTQTRRVVKPQPETADVENRRIVPYIGAGDRLARELRCPYGGPGDHLWVREDHYRYGHWEPLPGVRTKTGRMKWRFVAETDEIRFDPPASFRKGRHTKDPETPAWHKRLGRFMPRAFSRLTLELTEVRVERVQDMSEADAIAEGWMHPEIEPLVWYRHLWESINGPGSWGANPWVWVVSFRDVTKASVQREVKCG